VASFRQSGCRCRWPLAQPFRDERLCYGRQVWERKRLERLTAAERPNRGTVLRLRRPIGLPGSRGHELDVDSRRDVLVGLYRQQLATGLGLDDKRRFGVDAEEGVTSPHDEVGEEPNGLAEGDQWDLVAGLGPVPSPHQAGVIERPGERQLQGGIESVVAFV